MLGEKVVDGRSQVGALRSTFVLDESGTVVLPQYAVPAVGHLQALREELRRLSGQPGAPDSA